MNIQHGLHASYGIFLLKQCEQTLKLLEIKKTKTVDLYTMWEKTRIIIWAEPPGAEQKMRRVQIIKLCCSVVKLCCPSSTDNMTKNNSVLLYSHLLRKKKSCLTTLINLFFFCMLVSAMGTNCSTAFQHINCAQEWLMVLSCFCKSAALLQYSIQYSAV